MCDCQKYKVIKAENGILIEDELNNFDLSQLDWLEDRMYKDFIKHSTKAEALQIIINSVEGDYSQLSPKLAEIAEKQDCEEEFKNGGGVDEFKIGDVVYNKEHNTIGIVRDIFDRKDLRTDADGVVYMSELEHYDKLNPIHKSANIAPSTKKELGDKYSNGGGIGFIGKPEHYRYLTIQKVKNGLLIILNEEGVEELNNITEDNITSNNPKSDTDIWLELFEDVQGNSEYIFHPDMGESGFGLTSAEGITDGYYYEGEDRSNLYKTDYPESAKVYWFPNYMVERSIYTMIKNGEVLFTEAESLSNGGGVEESDTFVTILKDFGFKEKRGAYDVRVFYNKEKDSYANYDTKLRQISVDDDNLRFSIRDLISYLESKGFTSGNNVSQIKSILKFKNGGGVGETHKYKLGDKYRSDFDYDGMLDMGLKANVSWGYDKLKKLHDSFEDVNYATASKPLWDALQNVKNGNKELAEQNIIEFHKKVKEETMFNPDMNDNEMENGGTIDSNRRFTEGDFNKMMDDNGFKATWSGYVWEIYPEGGGKVLGKFNPKKNTLFIAGKKDLSNILVKYLQENSYVSSEEYVKLKNGGSIFGNIFGTGRSKSSLAKDRKYFNESEKHEVNYATTFKRKKKTYDTFDNGGDVDLIEERKSVNKPKKLYGNVDSGMIVTGKKYKYLHEPNTYITLLKRDNDSLTFTDDNGDWINISNLEIPNSVYDFKATHNITMPESLSITEVESKIGRKINSWKDNSIQIGKALYEKVYLKPEYKKIFDI